MPESNGVDRTLNTTPRAPSETKLLSEHPGRSYVSKVRPEIFQYSTSDNDTNESGHGLSYRSAHSKVAPFDSGHEQASSPEPQDSSILSPSSTLVFSDDTQDTSVKDDSISELFPMANSQLYLRKFHETSKTNALSDTTETDSSSRVLGSPAPSCQSHYRVPISKVRPCVLDSNTENQASKHQGFGPKVQPAVDLQAPGGRQTLGRFVTDMSLGFFTTEAMAGPVMHPVSGRGSSSTPPMRSHTDHHSPALVGKTQPPITPEHPIEDCHIENNTPNAPVEDVPQIGKQSKYCSIESDPNRRSSGHVNASENNPSLEKTPHIADAATESTDLQKPLSTRAKTPDDTQRHQTPGCPTGNPLHTSTTPPLLHAPIPVSKIRPFFQARSTNGLEDHGRGSVPKVGPVFDLPSKASSTRQSVLDDSEERLQANRDKVAQGTPSNTSSGNNEPLASILDYKRTTQWLKDVLGHPETYTPKYTQRPSHGDRVHSTLPERKGHSESVLSYMAPSKSNGGPSVLSEKASSGFDRVGFKRAVSDLERLLNEALAIATQVVEQPASSSPQKTHKRTSASLHSHCRSFASQKGGSNGSRPRFSTPSADGSGDFEPTTSMHDSERKVATTKRHVEPSSNLPNQSKLSESIQNPSLQTLPKEAPVNDSSHNLSKDGGGLRIPRRKSSKKLDATSPEHVPDGGSRTVAQDIGQKHGNKIEELGTNLTQPANVTPGSLRHTTTRSVHANHRKIHRPAAGQELELPERDTGGRPLHIDHGISLHRRSHVSLRGAQGFSLAKSHKRQPVARD
ncbi:hypothetical protein QQS21_007882 [Conoideocrella luteorostrata]|uniref:Uncharacterized protein n=1 Tax=Conoideocrella luteorostrata TaxID=1105319 RepID=A0AAJ0CJX7_9HYPO|nr:hypothetical protein QQS21_007882 [Conoideocrella luteorostrata]